MIITVTLNPTVDRTLEAHDFEVGTHARARLVALVPAGKGVNVARGAAKLGAQVCACVLVGRGEAGLYEESLRRDGIECALCPVSGITRANTTVLDPVRHTNTHLREQGITVTSQDVSAVRVAVSERLAACEKRREQAIAVFSGSLPPGLGSDDFVRLLAACKETGATVVVDTSGDALGAAVESGCVDTIKPNLTELGQCLGEQVGRADGPSRAAGLLDRVKTVLLTLGEDGAWLVQKDLSAGIRCAIAQEEVQNTVGCGDAFLAGWLCALDRTGDPAQALRWAVAAGSACACSGTVVDYSLPEVESMLARCRPVCHSPRKETET